MPRSLHLAGGVLTNRVFLDDGRVMALLALLNREGEEARVVGGAVRNALLGLPTGDIDITTTATPDVVMARAKTARLRTIPTGVAHGTVTVVVRGEPFEVTTLREDVETDGRHAVVLFGRSFVEDARRRDFTINALSVDPEGRLYDYTEGVADLAAGRVRFIDDSTTRIREDYLRVLRFFRFSASYTTGELDPEGLAACAAQRDGLDHLSRERVRAELFKLLTASRVTPIVEAMQAIGVLPILIGDPCRPWRQARLSAVEQAGGWPPDPLRTLAALGLATVADVSRLRDRLRLSNEERDRLVRLAEASAAASTRAAAPDALAILALLYSVGRQSAVDVLLMAHVDSGASPDDPGWQQAARQAASVMVPTLAVSGADVMARGFRSGPQIGAVLKDVQARWIRAGFPEEPAVLHRLLDESIVTVRGGAREVARDHGSGREKPTDE
ncbi:CCA tRNA nucleotidyltransferase [Lichenifustis flavocetrariae]|uniref:CCA tRNA nucleotidyltransferase n=1 Tax=Lichenifustis flavocetrariae TaxID=2949735 RepID=A0AA41YU11_9HYPH|nr:CCA tRNA nucleotidyltransferase [Lichenifustis flavocetrariae]MCW6508139.1 CCA tRNA nucleotidyltransferase [Lichenifustis flavocetrariae]